MSRTLALALLLVALTSPDPARGTPLSSGEQLTLDSKVLGETRTVLVALPQSYGATTVKYPVLYLTDAQWQFDQARTATAFLARNGVIPEIIVVGVTNPDRTRDLYATHADFKQNGRVIPFPTSGQGDRFLEFVEKELVPWVEAKYRTQPLRILAGHSAGGNFALHAMRVKPSLFQAIIAASPWLAWDDGKELNQLLPFVKGPGVKARTLFLTHADDGPEMAANLDQLVRALQARHDSTLRWKLAVYPDETHDTGALKGYYDGLRMIFQGWSLPRDPKTNFLTGTLEDMKAYYVKIGDRLGYALNPPETAINELGYQYVSAKSWDAALEAFRYNTTLYPRSANVWDSLGDALSQSGRNAEALESYRKAVLLAEQSNDPNLAVFREHVAQLAHTDGPERR